MVIIPLFGLGHVAYIAGGIDVLRRLGLHSRPGWLRTLAAAIAFWMILGVVLWLLLVYPSGDHVAARWPCLAYSVLLATTTGLLTALAVLDRRFVPMAVGAVLFLASDGFLAVRLFQDNALPPRRRLLDHLRHRPNADRLRRRGRGGSNGRAGAARLSGGVRAGPWRISR